MFFICMRDTLLWIVLLRLTGTPGLVEGGGADIDRLCSSNLEPSVSEGDLMEQNLVPSDV